MPPSTSVWPSLTSVSVFAWFLAMAGEPVGDPALFHVPDLHWLVLSSQQQPAAVGSKLHGIHFIRGVGQHAVIAPKPAIP